MDLTKKHVRAAELVADDTLSDAEIARRVGVSERTLTYWKRDERFRAAVAELVAAFGEAVRARGIAVRERRIAALDDRHRRMQAVIDERAARGALHNEMALALAPSGAAGDSPPPDGDGPADGGERRAIERALPYVPGYASGLLVHQRKMIGAGKSAEVIDEYAVDTGLLREMREHEKQAAQEVGQWTERRELSGKDGGAIVVKQERPDFDDVTDEELDQYDALLERIESRRRAAREGGAPSA